MRVRLLVPLGGHDADAVLDHDQAAAEWLVSAGLAVHVSDENADLTEPSAPKTTPVVAPNPQDQRRPRARRSG